MNAAALRDHMLKFDAVQRMIRWLDAMPRPVVAIEIAWNGISAVRLSRTGSVELFAMEPLAAGMIVPSAVDTNIVDSVGVRAAMARACSRVQATYEQAAVLLPDAVIRVFVQHFDDFPRGRQEAIPLLQWKLKKSIPFEMTDSILSYIPQVSPKGGFDIVTTIARLRIIREYEEVVESAGMNAGVVSSSSLSALALLESQTSTLVARVSDQSLTTCIIRNGALCAYRCTDLHADSASLSPSALLDEIYPLAAYYHESWQEKIAFVYLSGIGDRIHEFATPIEGELQCKVEPLQRTDPTDSRLAVGPQPLAEVVQDGLAGWILCRD
jgi:type IV pilus assembly protein PilM